MFVHNIYSSWESYTTISTEYLFCSLVSEMKSDTYLYAVAAAVIAVGILVFAWIGFVASPLVAVSIFGSALMIVAALAVACLPMVIAAVLVGYSIERLGWISVPQKTGMYLWYAVVAVLGLCLAALCGSAVFSFAGTVASIAAGLVAAVNFLWVCVPYYLLGMILMYAAKRCGWLSESEAVSNPAKDRRFLYAILAVIGVCVVVLVMCIAALLLTVAAASILLAAAAIAVPVLVYVLVLYLVMSMFVAVRGSEA